MKPLTSAGPCAGVIMLNTHFPRLPGDIGNPASFHVPVLYRTVSAATVGAVISDGGTPAMVARQIITAGRELEAAGADLLLTSCGFLGEVQQQLESEVAVPVMASSLALIPQIRSQHGRDIGVLTFDSRRLSERHFYGHYDHHIHIAGIENGSELHRVIAGDLPELDEDLARQDVLAALNTLLRQNPGIRALVLECTNLSPYIADIRKACGLPVYDLLQAAHKQLLP